MFPISDSIKSKGFPFVTIFLIALNVYVFYKELTFESTDDFIYQYALTPNAIHFGDIFSLIPFVTSMFLHAGFLHIISNMWFLWIFGDNVEGYFGKIQFILLYLVSGIAGSLLQYSIDPHSSLPMIGASGAVSGVLGAYYILFPNSKIKTLLPIFLFFTIVDLPAMIYLIYWFIIQFFSGVASGSFTSQGGVAFWAHIGGFVTGVILARASQRGKSKGYIEGEIV